MTKVFTLFASGPLNWRDLYYVFEIIQGDAGGIPEKVCDDCPSKKKREIFARTACSPKAIGLQARHGIQKGAPPTKPMPLSEARTLIDHIAHHWLDKKASTLIDAKS